jgi:hypothetical protein
MSPREAIDPLAALYGIDVVASAGALRFVDRRGKPVCEIDEDDLVSGKTASLVTLARTRKRTRRRSRFPSAIPKTTFKWRRSYPADSGGRSARQSEAQAAVMTHRAKAQSLAGELLRTVVGRGTAEFSLRPGLRALQPGDLVARRSHGGRLFQIQRITDGASRGK